MVGKFFRAILDFITPTHTYGEQHQHEWGKWETWGISYQERRCKTCGWHELMEKERAW